MSSKRDLELFIVDVFVSIEKIKSYTKNFFRNLVSHGYFGISQEEVWNVVTEKLDLLEEDMKQTINKNFDLSIAIEQELPRQANSEIIKYLKNLKKENSAR